MLTCQDAILNLSSLLNSSQNSKEVLGEGLFTPIVNFANEIDFNNPLHWAISVQATGESKFLLTGTVTGKVAMPCRRCLEPSEITSCSKLFYTITHSPDINELKLIEDCGIEEQLVFGTPEVNFSEFFTQIFVVDLPLTALCKEDCEGIAEGLAAKKIAKTPSPFAVLQNLPLNS